MEITVVQLSPWPLRRERLNKSNFAHLKRGSLVKISFKSTEKDGVNYVTSVWCNVCKRQKDNFNKDWRVRGAAAASSKIYNWNRVCYEAQCVSPHRRKGKASLKHYIISSRNYDFWGYYPKSFISQFLWQHLRL